ncbi:MAG: hypothetical protein SVR08_14365, partial [Spirochaetota bacterium]|nr:hypothetical protein [Spirochaetota bacterium]
SNKIDEVDEASKDMLLRRRAEDKEIETEFPDRKGELRRKKDLLSELSDHTDENFKLPYMADDIISASSGYRIYRRTLLNAEIYAQKGDFSTSISLYEGVNERIRDVNVNNKISTDIKYLEEYQQLLFERKKDEIEKRFNERRSNEIRVSFDGPVEIPEKINIGVGVPKLEPTPIIDPEKIAEEITKKIANDEIFNRDKDKADDRYISEIEELKESINQLIENKDKIDSSVEEKTEKYRSEIEDLKNSLNQLLVNREEIEKAQEEGRKQYQSEFENLKNSVNQLVETRDDIDLVREKEKEQYRSEIEDMKDNFNKLIKAKDEIEVRQKEGIDKFRSEIEDLKEWITKLTKEKEEIESSFKENVEKTDLDKQKEETVISKLNKEIQNVNDLIAQLSRNENKTHQELEQLKKNLIPDIPSTDEKPTVTEVKYDSPISPQDDEKTDFEILKQIPTQEAPDPRILELTNKKEEEDEEDDDDDEEKNLDFELLSEYGKDDISDDISDEDIFQKILEDSRKREKNAFEILGDKKEKEDDLYELDDTRKEIKNKEEEDFYKKFLKHERRKKKELPILKVSYDFSKLPDIQSLSKDLNLVEYSFYKYRPMLEKANELVKKRKVNEALNYYKVVLDQNIPQEFKVMVKKNIEDLTEYIEKFLLAE